MSARLTHLDAEGRARMVDVGDKAITERECVARGAVRMAAETLDAIREGRILKGDVFATARLGAIQAAKRTHEWIPLAHPLPLDFLDVELTPEEGPEGPAVAIEATARARARTGVEMEALVAASAAGLIIYDMCKAIDRGMTIEGIRLMRKRGGKSGEWVRPE